ncbi:MAG: terpene cyclase/mutase family protein, partial [Nocardioidaceae bacterium]|nr:terpene cyclase/mutase family protein [Nocardioidaceae bacterium]
MPVGLLALLLVGLLVGTLAAPTSAAAGRGWNKGECRRDRGVTVVVDFRRLDHRTVVRCVTRRVGDRFSGLDALKAADVRVRGVDGRKSFVCRLQGRPRAARDLNPGSGTYHENCKNNIPPASAYWAYYQARDGGRWKYSQLGAGSSRVIRGGFEGWSFHLGSGPVKPPRHDPRRPGRLGDLAGQARPVGTDGLRSARRSASWLRGELRAGRLPGPVGGTDWGLTIDALWALHTVGRARNEAAVATIADAVARHLDAYVGPDLYGDPGARVAGAMAKVLVAAVVAGRDPSSFGSYDLRREVLGLMQGPRGRQPGRFSDRRTGSDTSNTLSQSLSVIGLARTGGVPRSAVAFLRDQQCPAGWFRMYADDGGTCAAGLGRASTPDVDGTAMAVQALLVARATGMHSLDGPLDRALDWLVGEQADTGSYGGGQGTSAHNANSTGLATQALAAGGRRQATQAAVDWLRALQLNTGDVGGTPALGEQGAVAYDPAAYRAALAEGMARGLRDQWRRSTTQAVLGLTGESFLTLGSRGQSAASSAPEPRTPVEAADPAGMVDESSGTAGFCPDDDGVTVVVDSQELGDGPLVRCAPGSQPRNGLAVLHDAGIEVEGVQRWGAAFVCRLEGRPAPTEPLPLVGDDGYTESCVDTPPTGAYWSYWQADIGGEWRYSRLGADSSQVVPGSVEGWSFALNGAGAVPAPRVAPDPDEAAAWVGGNTGSVGSEQASGSP